MGAKGLGINLVLDTPNGPQSDEEYTRQCTEKLIEIFKIARTKGIYEDRIMRKIRTFVTKNLHVNDCGGCGNQLVVTPEGRIGPCQAYLGSGKNFSLRLDDHPKPHEEEVFKEWAKRSPFSVESCHFCDALGICGGGCAYNSALRYGTIWKMDERFCIHSKMILEWMIWDLWEQCEKGGEKDGREGIPSPTC